MQDIVQQNVRKTLLTMVNDNTVTLIELKSKLARIEDSLSRIAHNDTYDSKFIIKQKNTFIEQRKNIIDKIDEHNAVLETLNNPSKQEYKDLVESITLKETAAYMDKQQKFEELKLKHAKEAQLKHANNINKKAEAKAEQKAREKANMNARGRGRGRGRGNGRGGRGRGRRVHVPVKSVKVESKREEHGWDSMHYAYSATNNFM